VSVATLLGAAARVADALGHEFIGTEHQLLAITDDPSLSTSVLTGALRDRARERVKETMRSAAYGGH
jgi:hypothetical protein